jgi:hypothetical protein
MRAAVAMAGGDRGVSGAVEPLAIPFPATEEIERSNR